MPLLDHFHSPLDAQAPWTSINSFWVVALSKWLNRTLPTNRFRAFAHVHLGQMAEADIAEFERDGDWTPERDSNGSVATLAIPEAVATVKARIPEEFEVEIRDHRDGMRLVGVIEFVSPANKDREQQRRKIVSKCSRYLADGLGVILVDVVTNRHFNLHNELMELLEVERRLPDVATYVVGYRPKPEEESNLIDIWPYTLRVGSQIPPVPLALKGGPTIMIDLESSYMEAVADHGVPT